MYFQIVFSVKIFENILKVRMFFQGNEWQMKNSDFTPCVYKKKSIQIRFALDEHNFVCKYLVVEIYFKSKHKSMYFLEKNART